MSSLREISGNYLELSNMLLDDETDQKLIQAEMNTIELLDYEFELKAENYAKILANLDDDIQNSKKEELRLSTRRKVLENRYKWLKDILYNSMKITGKTDFSSGNYKFKICKNGGKLPIELLVDVDDLPDDLVIITKKPNNDAIRLYIETTGDVTYARFGKRGEHLKIK